MHHAAVLSGRCGTFWRRVISGGSTSLEGRVLRLRAQTSFQVRLLSISVPLSQEPRSLTRQSCHHEAGHRPVLLRCLKLRSKIHLVLVK